MSNILIVEDNPHFRKTLRSILSHRFPSFRVAEAETGASALEKIESHKQDLVLLDIALPDMSGIGVAQKIKASHPECIVIMLTGYDTPEYREAALRAGADGFLSKRKTNPREILEQVAFGLGGQPPTP